MRAYFSKFFITSLPSEQRREFINSKHEGDENRYILGGILLNKTLDHLDLRREMAELKRAK